MKKLIAIAILLMMMFSTHALASELKIGYASLQRALNESKSGDRARATLKAEKEKNEKAFAIKEKKLIELKTEIDKKMAAWNEKTKKAKIETFQKSLKELQQTSRKYETEFKKKAAKLKTDIIEDLREIIKTIAKKKGYTFILESSTGALLHAPENADITDELIKQYDKKTR